MIQTFPLAFGLFFFVVLENLNHLAQGTGTVLHDQLVGSAERNDFAIFTHEAFHLGGNFLGNGGIKTIDKGDHLGLTAGWKLIQSDAGN